MSLATSAPFRCARIATTAVATALAAFLSAGPTVPVASAQAAPQPGALAPGAAQAGAPTPGKRGWPGGTRADGPAGPGRDRPRDGMRGPMRPGGGDPVVQLLDKQIALQLTPAEVNQLIQIHEQSMQQGRSLRTKMIALMPKDRDAWRSLTPATRDSLGALMESMRAIRWRATSAATAVLTDSQRQTAAHLFAHEGRGHGRRGWGHGRDGMRGDGMRGGMHGPAGGPGRGPMGAPQDGAPAPKPAPGAGTGAGAAEGSTGSD